MIDKSSFKQLEKQSAKSFHQQKSLIKKVLAGQMVNCTECKKPLLWQENLKKAKISCHKGCTDIALEMD